MFAENLRTASMEPNTSAPTDAVRWPPPVRLGIGGIPWRRREMTEQKMIVFKP
jgi:hypothetical protein